MKKFLLSLIALAAFSASALQAQNITGAWQGTLKAGPRDLRIVIKISLEDDKPKAVMYSLDQAGGQPIPASAFTKDGSNIKMTVAGIGGNYEGKLSADGSSIAGTWTQGGAPLPLNLTRATPETAWSIPDPPPPPKLMAPDATPEFEVATIKPSKPDERTSFVVNRSGLFNATNTSVSDLIKFAYDLHSRQIKGPAWIETEKYALTGKPSVEGMPSIKQLKVMVQKLLADRFQLTFHREKKELSVYAIAVTKTGPKLTKEESNPNGLPGFGGGPRGLNVGNATMVEFAEFLQERVLDQPVVDQTGLGATRYDFTLKWTPDGSQPQLGGAATSAAPNAAPPADNPDAPPDLFTAFQQQLGLKLESTKAPVDVLVIDRIEKPSAN
jgi:bla regulator protein blaR1